MQVDCLMPVMNPIPTLQVPRMLPLPRLSVEEQPQPMHRRVTG